MLWIKAFHIFFVICWFAGVFYLPRLFVHHAMSTDAATQQRLTIMERKLYRFVTPLMVLAIASGLWLWSLGISGNWLHLKVLLVAVLVGYHVYCGHLLRRFAQGQNTRSHVWFRWFNEAPVVLLLIIIVLAVVKPF
ncbi:CopD family protein [Gammaproteobacteria bacterium]|nr:CopD family protein [Gammaproteobacteria bacterium]